MSEEMKEGLETIKGKITDGELLDILFLLKDEKPAALIMGVDKETQKVLEEFCSQLRLKTKVVEGQERSLLDRLLGRDTRFMKDSVFLTKDPERFDILEASEGRFSGFSDRAVGKFLGYPESAVEYYVEKTREEPAGMEVSEKIEEMIEGGELDEKAEEYLEMLSYLPAPREDSIREAVETGRDRMKVLQQSKEEEDLELIDLTEDLS